MRNANIRNLAQLHFVIFIFGFTSTLGELISIDSTSLVWYRMLIASIFLGIYSLTLKKNELKLDRNLFFRLLLAGFLIALHWITFFEAIKLVGISITLSMLSSAAFFTALLEPIFYKRKLLFYELFLGAIAIAGILLIYDTSPESWFGILIAIIAAFLAALFTLINGKLIIYKPPAIITFYEMLTGTFCISIYLVFTEGFNNDFFRLNNKDILWLIILGSVCTAYAINVATAVMKTISPFSVMLTVNLEPIYGIILAFLIFGESQLMDTNFYIGLSIIILSVLSNSIYKSYKLKPKNKPSSPL